MALADRPDNCRVLWRYGYATNTLKYDCVTLSLLIISSPVFEPLDGKMQSFQSLSGSSEITLIAELSGGEGETSWQHAQLFRQSLKQTDEHSFEILIHLEDV